MSRRRHRASEWGSAMRDCTYTDPLLTLFRPIFLPLPLHLLTTPPHRNSLSLGHLPPSPLQNPLDQSFLSTPLKLFSFHDQSSW